MDPHALHHGMPMEMDMIMPAPGLGVDAIAARVASLGISGGYRLALPRDARGVYSMIQLPGPVEQQRVVHFGQYSRHVLLDIGGGKIGAVGRVTEWGVTVHQGLQYGWPNLLVMLAGGLALLCLFVSGIIVWWKRRPASRQAGCAAAQGRRQAGERRGGDRRRAGLRVSLAGASMVVVLPIDVLAIRLREAGWPPSPYL